MSTRVSTLAMDALPAALAALAFLGCGSGGELELAPVTGTVTYQGDPLGHGEVVFTPEQGTAGPQSVGKIDSGGSYRMRTASGDGAPLGKHLVTVHCRRPLTPEEQRNLVIPESLIPEEYSRQDESPLRFKVQEGRNEYPIELED